MTDWNKYPLVYPQGDDFARWPVNADTVFELLAAGVVAMFKVVPHHALVIEKSFFSEANPSGEWPERALGVLTCWVGRRRAARILDALLAAQEEIS